MDERKIPDRTTKLQQKGVTSQDYLFQSLILPSPLPVTPHNIAIMLGAEEDPVALLPGKRPDNFGREPRHEHPFGDNHARGDKRTSRNEPERVNDRPVHDNPAHSNEY